jgi:S1-C subfamily serine protease
MGKLSDNFKAFFLLLLYAVAGGCSGACASTPSGSNHSHYEAPVTSFIQLRNETLLKACQNDEKGKEVCVSGGSLSVSSGVFVYVSDLDASTSYVLTAGHSCKSTKSAKRVIGLTTISFVKQEFKIVDYYGRRHLATVVRKNERFDLCLLMVQNLPLPESTPPVKVAKKEPKVGDFVFNMAAPHGIVFPKALLIYHGIFGGYTPQEFAFYSLPTKPGSSGSAVLNYDGELIGIIFAGFRPLENAGLASPLIAVRMFLTKAIAQGEMDIWQRENKGKDRTTTQEAKMWEDFKHTIGPHFGFTK